MNYLKLMLDFFTYIFMHLRFSILFPVIYHEIKLIRKTDSPFNRGLGAIEKMTSLASKVIFQTQFLANFIYI